jgi:hypothetical protein
MALKISKVEVWAGDIDDVPGGLANVLQAIGAAGANVECVIARRKPDDPGKGTVFVTPIKGSKIIRAAREAGLSAASQIATLRIEGTDKPGLGGKILGAIAEAGVNVRGVSTAVVGRSFVSFIGLDNAADAAKAAKALKTF